MKKYLAIETFYPGCLEEAYYRFHQSGRMLPDGLHFVQSWLAQDGSRCFQIMETDQPELFEPWMACWNDLVDFEIVELGDKPQAQKSNPEPESDT